IALHLGPPPPSDANMTEGSACYTDPAELNQLQAELDSREARLAGMEQTLHNLITSYKQVVSVLKTSRASTQPIEKRAAGPAAPDSSNATPSPSRGFHLSPPTRFDGTPAQCDGFLLQCELVFSSMPLVFSTEQSRITYVLSLLTGRALEWATAVWTNGLPSTYAQLKSRFLAVFGLAQPEEQLSERLLNLQQGNRPVADYALEFRVLAARSDWGEKALWASFRRGLNPRIRSEMVFRGERGTLDRYIETAVTLDNQIRTQGPASEPVSERCSPKQEEAKPMQLGRLPLPERQRRLQNRLCLYCGDPSHFRLQCPVRPEIKVSGTLCCNRLAVPVMLSWGDGQVQTQALVDSGAAGCFMDIGFAQSHSIPSKPIGGRLRVTALDGQPLGKGFVDHQTAPVTVRVGVCHQEMLSFYLISSPELPLILGFPWLSKHDPVFQWSTGELVAWGPQCERTCLQLPCRATSIEGSESARQVPVPPEYQDLAEVFSKKRASELPPHRPWDCAIDLLPGTTPPRSRIYPLSRPEQSALQTYITEALKTGIIRPSTSPASAGFFFIEKKDGGLRPCIDYRGLNNICVKYPHP
uniref:Retrotransposon gag domain-containing protein n=1 Tax=Scleropages formosus TaxID=113540 RepID=A0A8C9T481_SCLFO